MKAGRIVNVAIEKRRGMRALGLGAVLVLLFGLLRAESLADFPVYAFVALSVMIPTFFWIRDGAQGIPVLPAFALLHLFYFAIPLVSGQGLLAEYSTWDVARAAFTVGLFMAAATAASRWIGGRGRRPFSTQSDAFSERQMVAFVFIGLALGISFQVALISGMLAALGSFFGLVRSIASTTLVISCYFLGVARARSIVTGKVWALGCAGLSVVVALSWSSFFLVTGAAFILAAALGFIITSKRVPWLTVTLVFALVSVLHAGKAEMRAKYWDQGTNSGGVYSVAQVPEIGAEWFAAGTRELLSGARRQSAIDRTSLLPLLLRAQRLSPQSIAFLKGETYALLPGMLVPRFLSPDKIDSQAGMDLLNIRYGILSEEGTNSTAVGWGLIAEAWANFGFLGEVGMGILIGFLSGALTRWSAGTSAVSRPTLLAIATMITLLNIEADFAGLLTSLFQAFVAVLIFLAAFRVVALSQPTKHAARLAASGSFAKSPHWPE